MITNPFKFGTIVDGEYFTNRVKETAQIKSVLASENHLVMLSPRRYGKTSLITKVVSELDRPFVHLDLQLLTGEQDLAEQLLKKVCRSDSRYKIDDPFFVRWIISRRDGI
ncbi:MAG: hypothetical protein PHY48_06940 [Candidatus Cloacimonetes bacterium]|nr:hypothetical protein [Candidatus Cloacimonadota bacterium]